MESVNTLEKTQDIEYPILEIEHPEYCKLKVHYEADPDIVETKLDEAIGALRNMKVPGFRKGKAPDYAIKIKLKPQLNQYIAREMATHAIDEIVFETDIKPIGQPKFENVKVTHKKFSCDIELYSKPEFELGDFKFDIPKPVQKNDEESLAEKSLFNLRQRVGEIEPYDEGDTVELGDQVTLSIDGTIDGEEFEGSKVEGEMYQVGTNRWPDFDSYIIGMQADETREFELIFDSSAPENLKNKTAKFSVTVHMGTKLKPHDLNEEFYEKMGVADHKELMDKLRKISADSLKRTELETIRSQAAIKLVEAHDFKVPQFMIDGEAKSIAGQHGIKFEDLKDEEQSQIKEQAEKNVKLTLILDSIRENEPDSVLNDNEAQQHLMKHLQAQGQNPKNIFSDKRYASQLGAMLNSIKDEFTLQWVSDQSNIVE